MQYSREWIASKPTVNVIALNEVLRTNESVALQVGFTLLQEIRLKFHQYFFGGRRSATHEDVERAHYGEQLQIKSSPMQWNLRI